MGPHASCLLQVEAHLKDIRMAGLASAWAMARRRPIWGDGPGGPGVCLGDGHTEACLSDMDMTGLAYAWMMGRGRPV